MLVVWIPSLRFIISFASSLKASKLMHNTNSFEVMQEKCSLILILIYNRNKLNKSICLSK